MGSGTPHPGASGRPRARSVPRRGPIVTAIAATLLFYLSVVASISAVASVLLVRTPQAAVILAVCIGLNVTLWLISLLKRRSAWCPLCRGTPFLDVQALKHAKAERYPLLSHGASNIWRSVFQQRFRCPYCGTLYDLVK
jgi:hypothetical protein